MGKFTGKTALVTGSTSGIGLGIAKLFSENDWDVLAWNNRTCSGEMNRQRILYHHAASYDLQAELNFEFGYPPTVNDAEKTDFAIDVAEDVAGEAGVEAAFPPVMGAEDFSYMLEARPGAYLMLGQGEGAGVHHAKYNFNDEIAPIGASFFARLVERAQPVAGA